MACALNSVGLFLWLDRSYTPVAVVGSVIVFNAAFGYSESCYGFFPFCFGVGRDRERLGEGELEGKSADVFSCRVVYRLGSFALVSLLIHIKPFQSLDPHQTIPKLGKSFQKKSSTDFSCDSIRLFPPEILPNSFRVKGVSISTATNWLFNFLVRYVPHCYFYFISSFHLDSESI